MNDLEAALIDGMCGAQRRFGNLTVDGYWLNQAPEHYIHGMVAEHVSRKLEFSIFLEASPKKIKKLAEYISRGQPSKTGDKRFDIVIWRKRVRDFRVRAVVEVKHSWNSRLRSIELDAIKIQKVLSEKGGLIETGYLLIYREAVRTQTIEDYGQNIAKTVGGKIVECRIKSPRGEDWSWGVILIRLDKE